MTQTVEPLDGPAKLKPSVKEIINLDPDYPPELLQYQMRLSMERELKDLQRQITHNHSELKALRIQLAKRSEPNA